MKENCKHEYLNERYFKCALCGELIEEEKLNNLGVVSGRPYKKMITEIQCKKQTTFAVIMKNKKFISYGMNSVLKDIPCQRINSSTGHDYLYCTHICIQSGHAEVVACVNAGEEAKGGTLYLIGHTYACKDCLDVMQRYGIIKLIICDTGEVFDFARQDAEPQAINCV